MADRAYVALEENIVTLKLAPGTVLSEAWLTESLEIGRTPVREALQRLANEGLVNIMPRRGVQVSEINLSQQLQLLDTRRVLERLIATRGAEKRTQEQASAFATLADSFAETAKSGDDAEFMRLDNAFNHLLLEACQNAFAAHSLRMMQGLSRRFWFLHYKQFLDLPLCAQLHECIARAIAQGDAQAAANASDALIAYIEDFTRATL